MQVSGSGLRVVLCPFEFNMGLSSVLDRAAAQFGSLEAWIVMLAFKVVVDSCSPVGMEVSNVLDRAAAQIGSH